MGFWLVDYVNLSVYGCFNQCDVWNWLHMFVLILHCSQADKFEDDEFYFYKEEIENTVKLYSDGIMVSFSW